MFTRTIFLTVFLGACSSLYGQASCGVDRSHIVLSKDKPTVYLTFERFDDSGKRANKRTEYVLLRLHNNTQWSITLPTNRLYVGPQTIAIRLCDARNVLGLRDDVEAQIQYQVEADQLAASAPTIADRTDVSWTSWLASGTSIVFKVPRAYIAQYLKVYVSYHYEWEVGERVNESLEPQHRAYFRGIDLPKDTKY